MLYGDKCAYPYAIQDGGNRFYYVNHCGLRISRIWFGCLSFEFKIV